MQEVLNIQSSNIAQSSIRQVRIFFSYDICVKSNAGKKHVCPIWVKKKKNMNLPHPESLGIWGVHYVDIMKYRMCRCHLTQA